MIEQKQIVIWGHKLHTHTHSYIHNGFFRAFQELGFKTLWLSNDDDVSSINFENTLFLTASEVDENIPIRSDCFYVLHNCDMNKYESIDKNKKLIIQVFTKDVFLSDRESIPIPNTNGFYIDNHGVVYISWGTDLLPREIETNIQNLDTILSAQNKNTWFIGMGHDKWDIVKNCLKNRNLNFYTVGGFAKNNISIEENMKRIQQSYLSIAVQTDWQTEVGYLPCRLFKNISYGRMVLTNNKFIKDILNFDIIYDNDIDNLISKGIEFENMNKDFKKERILKLMKTVRDKHTYINNIETIFYIFNLYTKLQ